MTAGASLWILLLTQLSLTEGLLGDGLLASVNQCRALHTELRVLDLSKLRDVTKAETSEERRWRTLDARGRELLDVERRRVPVDAGVKLADPSRLSSLRRALAAWTPSGGLEPRLKDRRGNTYAWVGKHEQGLLCLIYRPETDELERTWIALEALTTPAHPQLWSRGV